MKSIFSKKRGGENNGFTIIELILVMALFTILSGVVTINLLGASRSSVLNSALTALISDIKTQQTKSMTQDTEGRSSVNSYGLYFEEDKYTLFPGTSYNPLDSANFVVKLDTSLTLSTLLPSQTLVFKRGSGEVLNYAEGLNSITLKNRQDGSEKTVILNRLGIIDSIIINQ